MTDGDWQNSTDPQAMLSFVRATGRATDRKLRLFAVACCRRVWQYLEDKRSRRLVEVAELYADRAATSGQLRSAFSRAAEAQGAIHHGGGGAVEQGAAEAVLGLRRDVQTDQVFEGITEAAGEARAAEAWGRIHNTPGKDWRTQEAEHGEECDAGAEGERRAQAALLRDIFGSPFCPRTPLAPPLLAWNDGLIPRLAQAAYEHRLLPSGQLDPQRLAVLADALLDAGCPADDDLLLHLRGEGPHWRGCWAMDQVLGRS